MSDILDDYYVPRFGDQRRLTIVGDRQAGKSYQLQRIALEHARRGEFVVYDCDSIATAEWRGQELYWFAYQECADELHAWRKTYGDVQFANGGRVVYRPSQRYVTDDLTKVTDVHLIDDTHSDLVFRCAKLVVRAVLR